MTETSKTMKRKPTEGRIDEIVAAQADDDSAWEGPIQVKKSGEALLPIPAELAARAAFFARLHREKGLAEWFTRIIQERVEFEEIAFAEVKRDIKTKQDVPAR